MPTDSNVTVSPLAPHLQVLFRLSLSKWATQMHLANLGLLRINVPRRKGTESKPLAAHDVK